MVTVDVEAASSVTTTSPLARVVTEAFEAFAGVGVVDGSLSHILSDKDLSEK